MSRPNVHAVHLSAEQRDRLDAIARNGKQAAKVILHARVLLLADQDHERGRRTDNAIADALGIHPNTARRVRWRFAVGGLDHALYRSRRAAPAVPRKVDGRIEAHLIAICCSPAPEGRVRWTLDLLVDQLVKDGFVTSISRESVRKALKKNELKPWRKRTWCIPDKDRARFVAQMEDVLDVYCAGGYDERHPLVCMDESSKQLLGESYEPIPARPGQTLREDHHYERNGVRALFMFFDPILGTRRVSARTTRKRQDWAQEVKEMLTKDYPDAEKVTLVCDNLNTHNISALYATFPAAEAHALARRLEIHYTPVHGSWLNMAEIELSALSTQCLNRRIGTEEKLKDELRAWQDSRNADPSPVQWRFSTADARVKLARLYPQF